MATPTIPPIRSPFSNGKPGLVPAPNGAVGFLKSDGTFETPTSEAAGYTEAANFDALPEASTVSGEIYAVLTPQGVPFISRKPAGYYRSDGESWTYLGDLSDPYFNDGYLTFSDDADATKKLQFALSDIATETTRTVTWPDKDGTVAMLSDLGGGGFPTGNLVWVDAVNGDDDTGERGRPDKPFLTIEAAVAAAASGDTVVRLPGAYTINASISKNGVNHYSFPGVRLTLNATPYTDGGSAISFKVDGLEEWTSPVETVGVFNFTSPSSEISITAYGTTGSDFFPGFQYNVSYANKFSLNVKQAGRGSFYRLMNVGGSSAVITADIWDTDIKLGVEFGHGATLIAGTIGAAQTVTLQTTGFNRDNGNSIIRAGTFNGKVTQIAGALYLNADMCVSSSILKFSGTRDKRSVIRAGLIKHGSSPAIDFLEGSSSSILCLSGCHFHGTASPVVTNAGDQTIYCIGGGATSAVENGAGITVVGSFTVNAGFDI